MKHREWLGNKDLVLSLLEKAGLGENKSKAEGEKKLLMRRIIEYKYIEYMTINEITAHIMFEYNIDLDKGKYYRLHNEAIRLMELNSDTLI